MAERGGFEPPVGFYSYNGLANRPFRPLRHLSVSGVRIQRAPPFKRKAVLRIKPRSTWPAAPFRIVSASPCDCPEYRSPSGCGSRESKIHESPKSPDHRRQPSAARVAAPDADRSGG